MSRIKKISVAAASMVVMLAQASNATELTPQEGTVRSCEPKDFPGQWRLMHIDGSDFIQRDAKDAFYFPNQRFLFDKDTLRIIISQAEMPPEYYTKSFASMPGTQKYEMKEGMLWTYSSQATIQEECSIFLIDVPEKKIVQGEMLITRWRFQKPILYRLLLKVE